jgi:hypothetical protein
MWSNKIDSALLPDSFLEKWSNKISHVCSMWEKMNLYHAQPSHDHDNVLASNSSEAESSPFIKEKKCQQRL